MQNNKNLINNYSIEEIKNYLEKNSIQKVKIAITDLDGILRGKYVSVDKFLSAVKNGFGFCNVIFGWDSSDVCYDNVSYTGWHTGYPDATAKIDLNTFRVIPWDNKNPFFLADFINTKNEALEVCPRQVLKKQLLKLEEKGFNAKVGFELEWFNFKETPNSLQEKQFQNLSPLTPGMFGYSILRSSYNSEYFNTLFDNLNSFKIPIEGLHTETGPGVYEAAIAATTPLEAADRGMLFKTAVKEIAYKHGIIPSFMAKWSKNLPGCGGHIHLSLQDKNSKNIFYNESNPNKMSKIFEHFIAGLIYCLPSIQPFFAPNVNSYKRLVEGFWAPVVVTWGIENRTAALRVIPINESSTRLEIRLGGADFNTYLALAASLAAGLYGIEKKLELTDEPIVGDSYKKEGKTKLHRNLLDATNEMMNSKVVVEMFGKDFIEHFGNSRLWEWQKYQEAITNWELERYFEII